MILPLERIGKDGSVHKVEEFMEQGPMPTVPFFPGQCSPAREADGGDPTPAPQSDFGRIETKVNTSLGGSSHTENV